MKPPKVLVPLAPGFEEIEAITVIDILRRAGVEVVTAGLVRRSSDEGGTQPEQIVASRGTRHVPDCSLGDVSARDFDMIVLPGGQPGTNNLRADPRIQHIIRDIRRRSGSVAAICAAPGILAAYGVLDGRVATSHPVAHDEVAAHAASYSEERVVVDGPVVTSRSAGTAMEFAFKLVELLCGPEKVAEVNRGVLALL